MFDWFFDWVEDRINDVKSWASSLFASLSYVWNVVVTSVKNWALATFAKIGEVASTIWNYITNVYNTISNYITNVYNTISNYITEVYNTVKNYITNTYNTIVNNITNVIGVTIEKVAEWFTSIGGATREWAEGLFVRARDVWNTITGNLGEWWRTQLALLNETFGWVQDFRDRLEEFFTDPVEFLWARFTDWFLGREE